jgi:hypothetical protein
MMAGARADSFDPDQSAVCLAAALVSLGIRINAHQSRPFRVARLQYLSG